MGSGPQASEEETSEGHIGTANLAQGVSGMGTCLLGETQL